MWGQTGATPKLIRPPKISQQLLITEYLQHPFTIDSIDDFKEIAYTLGKLHGLAHLYAVNAKNLDFRQMRGNMRYCILRPLVEHLSDDKQSREFHRKAAYQNN